MLLSTSATIFLGSPHRNSEHARLGDVVRSMANLTLRVDAEDIVLQELTGANSVELELSRREFVRLWNDYNFKVKTFQESMESSTARPAAVGGTPTHRARVRADIFSSFGAKRAFSETPKSPPRRYRQAILTCAGFTRQRTAGIGCS